MKNKHFGIITKLIAVVAGCLLFASFSPSLDGRAVVVEEGVFPQGLFAKTVGYLPGDIICVANINGDAAVDILVIGALDPSEGVAIMLSPEAAQAVGISPEGNNIVKITKRNGVDDRVYGSAVITNSNPEPLVKDDVFSGEVDEKPGLPMVEEPSSDITVEEEFTEAPDDNFETIEAEDNQVAEDDILEKEVVEEELEEENPFVMETPLEEEFLDENLETEEQLDEMIADPFEEEVVPESDSEDAVEAELFVPDELEALEDKKEADSVNEEIVEEEPVETEITAEESESDEFVADDSYEDVDVPAEIPVDEEELEPVSTAELVDAEELNEIVDEEEVDIDEDIAEDNDLELDEELESDEQSDDELESDDVEVEEYEAIVLVPAEANPPVAEEDDLEPLETADEDEVDVELESETVEAAEVEEVSVEVTVTPEEPEAEEKTAFSYEKYIVPSLKDLKKNSYYIQIAVYKDDANIENIINTYGKNYPITLVPLASGAAYQIMVGPVSMDEYKVVLERFKSYGYKDAFLRKIK